MTAKRWIRVASLVWMHGPSVAPTVDQLIDSDLVLDGGYNYDTGATCTKYLLAVQPGAEHGSAAAAPAYFQETQIGHGAVIKWGWTAATANIAYTSATHENYGRMDRRGATYWQEYRTESWQNGVLLGVSAATWRVVT